ncbi:MAG TPA: hypothetical protein DCZ94_14510 [Lentisphaeria bacterium]|nr:MAG: hypothetical protein A2X48_09740 [Lentisphaerae bacterium GWF2_49_21]HBC88159.1 hypothetical protein [Lentisphaeria bacterium]
MFIVVLFVLAATAGTSMAATLLQTDFNNAAVQNYANNAVINSGSPTTDDVKARVASGYESTQLVSIVDLDSGNCALRFTDNSTVASGPRAFKTITAGEVTTGATGNNEVTIVFDLTLLTLSGSRPTFQFLLNSGTSETTNSTTTAVQIAVNDVAKVTYMNGTSNTTGATLTVGTAYRFTIIANLSSTTQDVYSIKVAPVSDLSHPVMDVNDISTRAANIMPGIIVFRGDSDTTRVNSSHFVQIDNINITSAPHTNPSANPPPSGTLWQIGFDDYSNAEFSLTNPSAYTIPSDWQTRQNWTGFTRRIIRSMQPTLDLTYTLASVPQYGVEFNLRTTQVSYATPELAVYSNGQFAGMIQTWGTVFGSVRCGDYRNVYRLYIPREKLQTGSNTLCLETPLMPYTTSTSGNWACMIGWDYLRLVSLSAPAEEPIHGRVVYGGTTLSKTGVGDEAQTIDSDLVRFAEPLLEWMGVAYSGNTMRANFWKNRLSVQPARMELLEKYCDLNMTVTMDHISAAHVGTLDGDGSLRATDEAALSSFFGTYGDLFQYYEVSNEPCGIGDESLAKEIAVAQYVNQIKPSNVLTAAPGYCFTDEGGDPDGWEGDPVYRLQLEQYCDTMGGHAYGTSYQVNNGGNFMENLASYGPTVNNGFPKELIVTEYGTNNWHMDFTTVGTTQAHAAVFDRNMRSLIAVGDRIMQHASHFKIDDNYEDFSLFMPVSDWTTADPLDSEATPGVDGEEDRLKTYRRLALAYMTHGQPLKYEILNAGDLQYKRVYVRPVDTFTLEPLPGSGATSDKVLLNFVNFEPTLQTVQARIYMPSSGIWNGARIGPGTVLSSARSTASLAAYPYVDITETLAARESVQYIVALTGTPLLVTDFNSATVQNYANNTVINSGDPTIDNMTARVASGYESTQLVSIANLGGGNRALRFTDNSTNVGGPRAVKLVSGISSGPTGDNHVNIMFDLTPLSLSGSRPMVRFLLNSGTTETSSGTISAVQVSVNSGAVVKYYNSTTEVTGPTLTAGTAYRFTIVADLSSTSQDTYSLKVAPVSDLNNPVLDVSNINTRAANITPGIMVFCGGLSGSTVNTSPFAQIDNINISRSAQ